MKLYYYHELQHDALILPCAAYYAHIGRRIFHILDIYTLAQKRLKAY